MILIILILKDLLKSLDSEKKRKEKGDKKYIKTKYNTKKLKLYKELIIIILYEDNK